MRVLITGGAGFIGSHVADALLREGHEVVALDVLHPQVHGESGGRPEYLDDEVKLIVGDVRSAAAVMKALEGVDAVYHFAARVGVGQSMYEPAEYTAVNTYGTGVLLECLAKHKVQRLVVASSMSIYGEGRGRKPDGTTADDGARSAEQMARGEWEARDRDGIELDPVPTPEEKPASLSSVYALSKYDQERLCLMFGDAYKIPTVALRFFNVYGPRQALSNPYTGVLAIFACRLLNERPPLIFEDGEQRRDFVSVYDVARACVAALTSDKAAGHAINVGSGESWTINQVAEELSAAMGRFQRAEVTGRYRAGDIRHCFADAARARDLLGYEAEVSLRDGLKELGAWLESQVAVDNVDRATEELATRGLTT